MVGWLFHDAWMWLQEEDEHDHIASDRDGKTEEEKEERERNHVKYGLIGGATRNEMRTSSVHKQDLRPEAYPISEGGAPKVRSYASNQILLLVPILVAAGR